MNNIINMFEKHNKTVIDLTSKINYIYQINKNIIKKVQQDKYNDTCFILEISKLDDIIKKYIHKKYKSYDLQQKENDNKDKEFFILFYKHKFLHTNLNNNDVIENFIKSFIKLTDEESKINNAKVIIYYLE
jgi:hypothetical protein